MIYPVKQDEKLILVECVNFLDMQQQQILRVQCTGGCSVIVMCKFRIKLREIMKIKRKNHSLNYVRQLEWNCTFDFLVKVKFPPLVLIRTGCRQFLIFRSLSAPCPFREHGSDTNLMRIQGVLDPWNCKDDDFLFD